MSNAIVVVEENDRSEDLVRRAARHTAGTGGTLYLLATITEDELQNTVSTLEVIGSVEDTTYDSDSAMNSVVQFLEDVAAEQCADVAVEYEPVVLVVDESERVDTVCEAASERDCDHIYASGTERTPAGKAIFGDFVQKLILKFDGFVTTTVR